MSARLWVRKPGIRSLSPSSTSTITRSSIVPRLAPHRLPQLLGLTYFLLEIGRVVISRMIFDRGADGVEQGRFLDRLGHVHVASRGPGAIGGVFQRRRGERNDGSARAAIGAFPSANAFGGFV